MGVVGGRCQMNLNKNYGFNSQFNRRSKCRTEGLVSMCWKDWFFAIFVNCVWLFG